MYASKDVSKIQACKLTGQVVIFTILIGSALVGLISLLS